MLNNVLANDAFHAVSYPGISMFLQVPVLEVLVVGVNRKPLEPSSSKLAGVALALVAMISEDSIVVDVAQKFASEKVGEVVIVGADKGPTEY